MSYGQSILSRYLRQMVRAPFLENHRPPWLRGMELDFYFPDFRVAIEFNGDQHFYPTQAASEQASTQTHTPMTHQAIITRLNSILDTLSFAESEGHAQNDVEALRDELQKELTGPNPPCAKCGGPHNFDTSVTSEDWNMVIRSNGLPDYLCFQCICEEFGKRQLPFTARLYSETLRGHKIHFFP